MVGFAVARPLRKPAVAACLITQRVHELGKRILLNKLYRAACEKPGEILKEVKAVGEEEAGARQHRQSNRIPTLHPRTAPF